MVILKSNKNGKKNSFNNRATSGFGEAIALLLANENYDVYNYRKAE
jgi:hypothetical protein